MRNGRWFTLCYQGFGGAMFNLDHAVEKWRERMFAAGIIKSTSLDELESHLRDHIARLTREGKGVEDAFDAAIQKIGQIDVLKKEFAKAEGFRDWLEHRNFKSSHRVLAVLWMAASCWLLLSHVLLWFIWPTRVTIIWVDILVVLAATCGIIGSALLSNGADWGRRIVRTLGFSVAAVFIVEVFFMIPRWLEGGPIFGRIIITRGVMTVLGLITVALLRIPHPNSGPKAWIRHASIVQALSLSDRGETAVIDIYSPPHRQSTMLRAILQNGLRGAVVCLVAAALFVVLGGPWFWMYRMRTLQNSPFAQDPRFVVTKLPLTGVWKASFFPSSRATCSIHALLQQCTEVTGVRYVIAKDVAAGEVELGGYTNTLTGGEFVQAFTQALQNNQPEFINFRTQKHYRENLVLLTNDAHTVLVLSKTMAREFERGAN
jgi:hypothetical protein